MFTEASWKASYILRYQICFLLGRRKKATGMALFSLLHDDPALIKTQMRFQLLSFASDSISFFGLFIAPPSGSHSSTENHFYLSKVS